MAKKRDKFRESIFVTNEYFEKCGVTRQVVRFSIEKGKIKPVGNLVSMSVVNAIIESGNIGSPEGFIKNPFLYYQRDADFLILSYWIGSYKRYLQAITGTWQKIKDREPFKNQDETELKRKLLDTGQHMEYLPAEIREFKMIVKKYLDFSTGQPLNPEDSFSNKFSREFTKGVLYRNERFINSKKNVKAFLTEENQNRFLGKKHLDIRRQQKIKRWFDNGEFQEIENLLAELRQRKENPPREDEGENFYRFAEDYYNYLKKRKGV